MYDELKQIETNNKESEHNEKECTRYKMVHTEHTTLTNTHTHREHTMTYIHIYKILNAEKIIQSEWENIFGIKATSGQSFSSSMHVKKIWYVVVSTILILMFLFQYNVQVMFHSVRLHRHHFIQNVNYLYWTKNNDSNNLLDSYICRYIPWWTVAAYSTQHRNNIL